MPKTNTRVPRVSFYDISLQLCSIKTWVGSEWFKRFGSSSDWHCNFRLLLNYPEFLNLEVSHFIYICTWDALHALKTCKLPRSEEIFWHMKTEWSVLKLKFSWFLVPLIIAPIFCLLIRIMRRKLFSGFKAETWLPRDFIEKIQAWLVADKAMEFSWLDSRRKKMIPFKYRLI